MRQISHGEIHLILKINVHTSFIEYWKLLLPENTFDWNKNSLRLKVKRYLYTVAMWKSAVACKRKEIHNSQNCNRLVLCRSFRSISSFIFSKSSTLTCLCKMCNLVSQVKYHSQREKMWIFVGKVWCMLC